MMPWGCEEAARILGELDQRVRCRLRVALAEKEHVPRRRWPSQGEQVIALGLYEF